MILSGNIKMYLDDVLTPLHEPMFGMAHTSASGSSFDDVVNNGTLSCLTITDLDSGSTRANIAAATTVKFVATVNAVDVDINGSVYQIDDAFGGTHFSVIFVVS